MLKIDVYPHILPPRYMDALYKKTSEKPLVGRFGPFLWPELHDVEARFRIMDRHQDYVQILTMAIPPVEDVATPDVAAELAKIANDEMAELLIKYPDRFVAAVACLPMNNMDAALNEIDRAITELRFRGIQITTNIMDKPLDSAEFQPLFEKMNYYDLPILMHPRNTRSGPRAFITNLQDGSAHNLAQQPFNWPFETTLAMGHLVYSGMLEKYPNLKIITHHCGGFVPYQANRIASAYEGHERAAMGAGRRQTQHFTKTPIEYYKMMYGDTACWGNTTALMCGLEFFLADHILFRTDMPFGLQADYFVRETIRSVEEMNIGEQDRRKIFQDNARKLFRLSI